MRFGLDLSQNTTKRGLICAPFILISVLLIVIGKVESATALIALTQGIDAWLKVAFLDNEK
jgi:hypothetical protein